MAVRKLAPEDMQPESFVLSPETESFADKEIAKYPPGRQASAVIALLTKAQEQAGGWLPRKAIEAVAAKLDMPAIRVMEVATFYTMFNLEPVGKYFIQFCGTTPCVLRGAGRHQEEFSSAASAIRTMSPPDGTFSWLEVECLGACSNAPMVQINDDYYEDLTTENFETLLDDLAAGRPVKDGSQIGRIRSEPFEAVNTLQDPALYDGSRRRRLAQAVRGAGKGRDWRGCGRRRQRPAGGQGRQAGRRPRHRERCRRYPGQARQGRRDGRSAGPTRRKLPIRPRRPRSSRRMQARSRLPRAASPTWRRRRRKARQCLPARRRPRPVRRLRKPRPAATAARASRA